MTKDKKQVEKEIIELKEKINELENGWKRTQADFENFRKKTEELKPRWIEEANLIMTMKILPVIDNFHLANQYVPENLKDNDWVKGIQLIEKHLNDILASTGLQEIKVNEGDDFDPNIHEAISCEQNDKLKDNQIIEVVETGYKLGSQVIRPAKVRVSKGK